MKIRWQDHIRNTEVALLTGLCPVLDLITRRRNVVFGHIARLSEETRQLTKHSGVTSTYLSDTFLIKAAGVVRAAQATDGLTRSAGTTTTYHQLICGGNPSCEVIRVWRYGPYRLRVNELYRHTDISDLAPYTIVAWVLSLAGLSPFWLTPNNTSPHILTNFKQLKPIQSF